MSHFSMKQSLQRCAARTEEIIDESYREAWAKKRNLRNQFEFKDNKNNINQEPTIDLSAIENSSCENREFKIKVVIEINEDGNLVIDLDGKEYKHMIIKSKINKILKIVFTK